VSSDGLGEAGEEEEAETTFKSRPLSVSAPPGFLLVAAPSTPRNGTHPGLRFAGTAVESLVVWSRNGSREGREGERSVVDEDAPVSDATVSRVATMRGEGGRVGEVAEGTLAKRGAKAGEVWEERRC
jgi:hypothetical protein